MFIIYFTYFLCPHTPDNYILASYSYPLSFKNNQEKSPTHFKVISMSCQKSAIYEVKKINVSQITTERSG